MKQVDGKEISVAEFNGEIVNGNIVLCINDNEYHYLDNTRYIFSYGTVTEDYAEENSFVCESCDERIHNDHYGDDGYCDDCLADNIEDFDNEQNAVRYRGFSKTPIASKEAGSIITSRRYFGVEMEMFNPQASKLVELTKLVDKAYGFEHDGSIAKQFSIEMQTPILSCGAGEKSLKETCKIVNKLGFKTDQSCGLHVHLDGSDFLAPQIKDNVYHLSDVMAQPRGKRINFVCFSDNVIKAYFGKRDISIEEYDTLVKFIVEQMPYRIGDIEMLIQPIILGNGSYVYIANIKKDSKAHSELYYNIVNKKLSEKEKEIICFKYNKNENFLKLKTLMYFHSIFSDFFLAMLPKSRRENNRYCKNLNQNITPAQILNCGSQEELETMWYKTKTSQETNYRKQNGNTENEPTKYFGINYHSLFSKNKTLEIRYHSGTTDFKKIAYWVSIHQAVLDKVANGEIKLESLMNYQDIFLLKDKVKTCFLILKLAKETEDYIKIRMNHLIGLTM